MNPTPTPLLPPRVHLHNQVRMPLQHAIVEQVLVVHQVVGVPLQLVVHIHPHKVLGLRRETVHDQGGDGLDRLGGRQPDERGKLARLAAHRGVVAEGGERQVPAPRGREGRPVGGKGLDEGFGGLDVEGVGGLGGRGEGGGRGGGDARVGGDQGDVVGLARGGDKDPRLGLLRGRTGRGGPLAGGAGAGRAVAGVGAVAGVARGGVAGAAGARGRATGGVVACAAGVVACRPRQANGVAGMPGGVGSVASAVDAVVGVVAWGGVLDGCVGWEGRVRGRVAFPPLVDGAIHDLGSAGAPVPVVGQSESIVDNQGSGGQLGGATPVGGLVEGREIAPMGMHDD